MAISAIPTGLPTFVQAMLSSGAKQLAEAKAVVKNLTDVETLGGDERHQHRQDRHAHDERDDGDDDATPTARGSRSRAAATARPARSSASAGVPVPDFTRLGLGLVLDSDATVGDDGAVIGDPTEAALVVLAAKMGVDAEETRARLPAPRRGAVRLRVQVHGDVPPRPQVGRAHERALHDGQGRARRRPRPVQAGARWHGAQVPIDEVRADLHAANQQLSRAGPPGARVRGPVRRRRTMLDAVTADPMSLDARTSASSRWSASSTRCAPRPRTRCDVALDAGIDVRMITGDHAVTAQRDRRRARPRARARSAAPSSRRSPTTR